MKYERKGSRVYGDGASYNCTNQITAEDLKNRLNNYETKIHEYQTIEHQYKEITIKLEEIQKQTIQAQMTLHILEEDLNRIKEALQC